MPAVTFPLLCYNYAAFLAECVDSILRQSFRDFEIVILDDGSTDNTPEVARGFTDPRIRYVRHPRNIGLLANFNAGIALASSEFVWPISADDALHDPGALARALAAFDGRPELGLVWSTAVELGGGGGRLANFDHGPIKREFPRPQLAEILVKDNRICAPAALGRLALYHRIGPAPSVLDYIIDWHNWFRIGLIANTAYLPEPLARYRIHTQSMTSAHAAKKRAIQFKERTFFHLWMMAPGTTSPSIAQMARVHLCSDFKNLFSDWLVHRSPIAEIESFLADISEKAAHLGARGADLPPIVSNCLRTATSEYLSELLRRGNLRSFIRGWKIRRRFCSR